MREFKFRSLSLNVRSARLAGTSWKARRHPLCDWIFNTEPDVVYLQEAANGQRKDIKSMFGDDWHWAISQEVMVGWDSKTFQSHDMKLHTLNGPQSRGFAGVRLIQNGVWFWACSMHLTSSRPDAPYWRMRQCAEVLSFFSTEDLPWVQIGANLASASTPPRSGARTYFQRAGLVHLRGKLRTSELLGEDMMAGRHSLFARKGTWYDDVLCGTHVYPTMGRVLVTNHLTDSNAIKVTAKIKFGDQQLDLGVTV